VLQQQLKIAQSSPEYDFIVIPGKSVCSVVVLLLLTMMMMMKISVL